MGREYLEPGKKALYEWYGSTHAQYSSDFDSTLPLLSRPEILAQYATVWRAGDESGTRKILMADILSDPSAIRSLALPGYIDGGIAVGAHPLYRDPRPDAPSPEELDIFDESHDIEYVYEQLSRLSALDAVTEFARSRQTNFSIFVSRGGFAVMSFPTDYRFWIDFIEYAIDSTTEDGIIFLQCHPGGEDAYKLDMYLQDLRSSRPSWHVGFIPHGHRVSILKNPIPVHNLPTLAG